MKTAEKGLKDHVQKSILAGGKEACLPYDSNMVRIGIHCCMFPFTSLEPASRSTVVVVIFFAFWPESQ